MTSDPGFAVFVAAALVLLITPGPSVLYIVARSVDQGVRAGLVSVLGMACGGIVHVAGAALGVSTLVLASAVAFSAVKFAGAGYLVYLGVRTLMDARRPAALDRPVAQRLPRVFAEAVAVQTFNPKAALFFLAFLPQFVDPAGGSVLAQVLVLGGVYHALALVTDSAYAVAAGRFGTWLKRSARVVAVQRRVTGVTYIGLGLLTAAGDRTG